MYEYGPYKKSLIKLNYNCPESEKSGSGPGSCSGSSGKSSESDNPEEVFWEIEEGRAKAGNWGGKIKKEKKDQLEKKADRKPENDSIENEPDDPEEVFWDIEDGRVDRRGAWGGKIKKEKKK